MGFSEDPKLQPILMALFLSMYLVTVLGNLLIILAVSSDSHFHTPIYFFFSILSLDDIGFISNTVPKIIVDLQAHSTVISHVACMIQMLLFGILGCMDDMLLTVMAYDRFVSICHPLPHLDEPPSMWTLSSGVLLFSLLDSQLHNLFVLQFNNFKNVEISNYFCDISMLFNLVSSDTFTKGIIKYFAIAVFGFLPVSGIPFSYYKIISNIMKISSKGRRSKVFSTYGSHLTVVCLFYGTSIGSAVSESPKSVLVASAIYTVVTPMLNSALRKIHSRKILSQILKQHV